MCQIAGWREHRYPYPDFHREVSKIAGYEPCAGGVRQYKERQVFRVWPLRVTGRRYTLACALFWRNLHYDLPNFGSGNCAQRTVL
jgi:hypothetical protein